MDIYNLLPTERPSTSMMLEIIRRVELLPDELQNKVKYLTLEHPTAKIIKDKLEELRCNLSFTFREKGGKAFCKIDGRDFFANEYLSQLNGDSPHSSVGERFFYIFDVSSSQEESD
jgi:hypothetical protein